MRTVKICSAITLLLFLVSCKPNDKSPKLDAEKIGTVISRAGLYLRSEPNSKSNKIDFMTFGTKVIILAQNGPEDELNYKFGRWYKVKFNNKEGWAFGGFIFEGDRNEDIEIVNQVAKTVNDLPTLTIKDLIVSEVPAEYNNLTIISGSEEALCHSEPEDFTESLMFENGKIKYFYQCYCGEDDIRTTQEGSYVIKNKSIIISLKKGIREFRDGNTNTFKKSDIVPDQKIIILYWIPSINGFITDEMLKYFQNEKIIHNIKDFYFIKTEEEINRILCQKGSFLSGHFFIRGYYHKK